ncbi:MAG: hypothetical protein OEM64_10460 [Gammaproteobacteria bacterium]|nr:hypothetical protein [Gammaproteobacteria bacterium]MDH3416718.1 hypothetical protein [Gammaproteobacteria bacterium]
MSRTLTKSLITITFLIMLVAVPVYGASVNKSINIAAGSESDGESSVNGSITVGEGAVVTGSLGTVNGSIRVADNAQIEEVGTVNGTLRISSDVKTGSLSTVNGAVEIGANTTVNGEVEAVNGRISLDTGSSVSGYVENVNGDISLTGSEIGGDLTTVNGNIDLSDASVIKGDLTVKKPSGWSFGKSKSRIPKITIGPGSRVDGIIRLEREVKLFISESAKVGGVEGEMSMDDAVRFSGKRP